jgi:hypothetical protein
MYNPGESNNCRGFVDCQNRYDTIVTIRVAQWERMCNRYRHDEGTDRSERGTVQNRVLLPNHQPVVCRVTVRTTVKGLFSISPVCPSVIDSSVIEWNRIPRGHDFWTDQNRPFLLIRRCGNAEGTINCTCVDESFRSQWSHCLPEIVCLRPVY